MLRAEPLLRVDLMVLASEMQDAALALARYGEFNPVSCSQEALTDTPAAAYRDAWLEADSRLSKLLEQCGDTGPLEVPMEAEAPTLDDLQELNRWLKDIWTACLACHESSSQTAEAHARLDALADTLATLEPLNVDIQRLFHPNSLLAIQIGSLPAAAVRRVTEALSMTGHVISRFGQAGDQVFVVIAGPRARHDEASGMLVQAGWHELPIPEELRTDPQQARAWLLNERTRLNEQAKDQCRYLDALRERHGARLHEARVRLALARPLAEAATQGISGKGGLAALSGWIPQHQLSALRAMLNDRFHGRYWLAQREPTAIEAAEAPSLVRYPAWLKPFVPLVRSYGVPRYGEFDPTLPFVLIYLLLFGAMFGDVGHGAAILLLSMAGRRRLGTLAWIGMAAGAVSMLFGLLYGSIFGYEDIIAPLWLSPLHDPVRMLSLAVGFGAAFLGFTMLINVYNQWTAGRTGEALFESSGVAGLMFYLGAILTLASLSGQATASLPGALMLIAGMATMAAYKLLTSEAGLGERLLVTLIETVETATSLFSNTLSFMRVAAFSLNHVALALAVFTLANGLDAAGQGITLVLGNIIIIVLEGAIVAIQALRLMYYEGFSRFYHGDGREFRPLRVSTGRP